MTVFLAQDLTRGAAHPEPDEFIRPVILSLSATMARIRAGTICDAKTIIGVLLAHRLLGKRALLR